MAMKVRRIEWILQTKNKIYFTFLLKMEEWLGNYFKKS